MTQIHRIPFLIPLAVGAITFAWIIHSISDSLLAAEVFLSRLYGNPLAGIPPQVGVSNRLTGFAGVIASPGMSRRACWSAHARPTYLRDAAIRRG